jgi:hypothetical protein
MRMDELPHEIYGMPLEAYAADLSLFDSLEPHEMMYIRAIFICKSYDLIEQVLDRYPQMKESKILLKHIMAK